MTRVLVTGGAGYIGVHTVAALVDAGFAPVVYDNFSHGTPQFVDNVPVIRGDVLDTDALAAALRDHDCAAVIHFAALIDAGLSVRDPAPFHRVNTGGVQSLLSAMHAACVERLVFSSTAAVYGNPISAAIDEDHPIAPINPYGASKAAAEGLITDANIPAFRLRYFNAAGAGRFRELHDPETHLIPLALQAARGARDHMAIFGTDYDTPDGTCIRDFVHVDDLADAHVRALSALLSGHRGAAINLGSGVGYSVRDVLHTVRDVTGCDFPIIEHPRRAGDPARLVCQRARAADILGWQPRHTLRSIIESA